MLTVFGIGLAAHATAPLWTGTEERKAGAPPKIQAADTGLKVVLVGLAAQSRPAWLAPDSRASSTA